MAKSRRFAACFVVCASVWSGSSVIAQDDPFGTSDSRPDESANAAPAAVAAETPEPQDTAATEEAAEDQKLCRCIGNSNPKATFRIEKALASPLSPNGLDFTQVPLEEVVNLLQEEYGIPIQVDAAALEATGLDTTEEVTVNLHNISVRSALELMLKQLQLTYIIENEVLMITTPEEAESQLVTCVYDVRDLVRKADSASGTSNPADFKPLIDTITSCISRNTWRDNGGGDADIRPLQPGLIVISQTRAVHDDIRSLLATMRELLKHPVP
jgi:hypothetical protein